MSTEGKLRVGLLCNGDVWHRWQQQVLIELQKVDGVEIVLCVKPTLENDARSVFTRLRKASWNTLLYRQYRRSGFGSVGMKQVTMVDTLRSIPQLECAVRVEKGAEYFASEDLDRIREYKLDVILRLGFNILKGDILNIPKYGVWSFHHGDEEKYRGGPPGVWEIMKDDTTIGTVLQRLTERLDGGYILKKGYYPVIHHSLAETVDGPLMDSAIWPAQICRRLLMGQKDAAVGELSDSSAPIYRYPSNGTFIHFRLKTWRNRLKFHRRDLNKHEEWNIGILYHPITEYLKDRPNMNVRWLPNPAHGSFRADPFGFIKNNELIVLYEKYDHSTGKGVIARVRPKRDNILKRSKTILDDGEHLSYPFVIDRNGEIFVVPESFLSSKVVLYRLSEDLNTLELKATLLEEPLLDPTIIQYDGLWWLMGTLPPHTNNSLYIYYSKELEGPYTPHQMNPVKSDIRNARPAGTPFIHEGNLYRPAQDSSETYGGRIILNQVVQLDTKDFREIAVKELAPVSGSSYGQGLHTISAVGDGITLIDGKRFVQIKDKKRALLKSKMRKFLRVR